MKHSNTNALFLKWIATLHFQSDVFLQIFLDSVLLMRVTRTNPAREQSFIKLALGAKFCFRYGLLRVVCNDDEVRRFNT